MLIAGFPTSPWQANCYVLATQSRAECLIVDPGPGASAHLPELLEAHSLRPAGVLLTHGHIDHVGDAANVCDRYELPCWIHPGDRGLLADPAAGLGPAGGAMLAELVDLAAVGEPADLREVRDGARWEVAGLEVGAIEAPGHTRGCVLYLVGGQCLSGDVLFRGAIGRMDLPGGSERDMATSLAKVLTLPDDMPVRPGHGPATTVGDERRRNPYLATLRP